MRCLTLPRTAALRAPRCCLPSIRSLTTKHPRGGLKKIISNPRELIKTDLQAHFEWIESQKPSYETMKEPRAFPDPSGVVERDLTAAVFDLKDMFDPRIHLANAPNWDKDGYEPSTPLSDDLIALMGATGKPITVAEYMRQALTHPLYGYYTNPEKDDDWDDLDTFTEEVTPDNYIIGAQGDFVTAPEISQIFGECIAVWYIIQWQALGKPKDVQLVEVGPGKGTLICDILRTGLKSFKDHFGASLRMIHLVEASPAMRAVQRRKLEELDVDVKIVFQEGRSIIHTPEDSATVDSKQVIRVQWHDSFATVRAYAPQMPAFIVCQELIDALPIHVFEKTDKGWRERMVDVAMRIDDEDEDNETKSIPEKMQGETKGDATAFPLDETKPIPEQMKETAKDEAVEISNDDATEDNSKEKTPRIRVVVAPDVTPALTTLLNVGKDGQMDDDSAEIGSIVEVCPEGILLVQDIYKFIDKNGGAALIIDYGEEGSSDSIRGFSKHKQVPFLSRPGQVDVTADVDFAALRHVVNSRRGPDDKDNKSPFAFGPIQQGKFLVSMGAAERAMHIIDDVKTTEEQAAELHDALERLISPECMGRRYKVLAIARKKDGIFEPAGF
jgi:NADH dehydrogenase [ubiquinone] 1 alpha subcomplex assembly factor 7